MAFVPASGIARVELIYLQHGQFVENVFNVRGAASGPLDEATLDAIRDVFRLWHVNTLRAHQASGTVLQRIEVRDMTVVDGLAKIYACTVNCAGANATQATPGNVTVAVKWSTGYAGRSRRGRTYHLGLWQSHLSGNQITTAYQAFLQTDYTALITACTAAGFPLVVYSRQTLGVSRDAALITPIVACSVDLNLDSMRRRLTGEGRGT